MKSPDEWARWYNERLSLRVVSKVRDLALEAMLKDEELRLAAKGPPCGCGHYSHGWSGFCTHMCCDTEDCECGGYGTFEAGA